LFGNRPGAEEKFKDKMLKVYRETVNHFHRAFARKHGKHYSLQFFQVLVSCKEHGCSERFSRFPDRARRLAQSHQTVSPNYEKTVSASALAFWKSTRKIATTKA
jgi:hypothetical protein